MNARSAKAAQRASASALIEDPPRCILLWPAAGASTCRFDMAAAPMRGELDFDPCAFTGGAAEARCGSGRCARWRLWRAFRSTGEADVAASCADWILPPLRGMARACEATGAAFTSTTGTAPAAPGDSGRSASAAVSPDTACDPLSGTCGEPGPASDGGGVPIESTDGSASCEVASVPTCASGSDGGASAGAAPVAATGAGSAPGSPSPSVESDETATAGGSDCSGADGEACTAVSSSEDETAVGSAT
jgi:hypothetical protein